MLILVLVLVLKDSLRTYFKSLSLSRSLGVRSLSLSLSLGGQVQGALVLVLGGQVLVLVLVLWGQVLVLVLVLGGQVLVNIPAYFITRISLYYYNLLRNSRETALVILLHRCKRR